QGIFEQLQKEYSVLIAKKNELLRDEALIKAKQDVEYQKGGQSNIVWLNKKKDEIATQLNAYKSELRGLTISVKQAQDVQKEKESIVSGIEARIASVKQELELLKSQNAVAFDEEADLVEIHKLQGHLLDALMSMKDMSAIEELRSQARAVASKLAIYLETLASKKKTQMSDLATLQNQLESLIDQKTKAHDEVSASMVTFATLQDKMIRINEVIATHEAELVKIENEITLSTQGSNQTALTATIEKQLASVRVSLAQTEEELVVAMSKIEKFNEAEEEKKGELMRMQKEVTDKQNALNRVSSQLNNINIELAKYQIRQEDLLREIIEEKLEHTAVTAFESTLTLSSEEAHEQIHSIKKQLEVIGSIDAETIKEYNETKERYDFLTTQVADLEQAIISLEHVIMELDEIIKKQFEASFKEINVEFQKFFKILFNGGKAELVKVALEEEKKSEDRSQESGVSKVETGVLATVDKIAQRIKDREKEGYNGIEIKAEPAGKRISSIAMLSGGERALTSIALICAIIANNNSPFVLLDEMDAALDESNAMRFASILKELSNKTQFIVITHTRATMNQAQVLYGVTMGDDGVSKLLSIELQDADKLDVVRH
ncbi:AAA family ATPase, partial [Candidatus Falkowbacteria bacterium]|nr:AAA family ATPase [Candidatus Falkowbacteria bacterium]